MFHSALYAAHLEKISYVCTEPVAAWSMAHTSVPTAHRLCTSDVIAGTRAWSVSRKASSQGWWYVALSLTTPAAHAHHRRAW